MYSPNQIATAFSNPKKIPEEIRRVKDYKAARSLLRFYSRLKPHSGINVVSADWDNLVILDACRYDVFEEVNNIPGELQPATSQGTSTGEWLRANFNNSEFPDTVFVSANPNLENIDAAFHDVVRLWDSDGWDFDLQTVHPADVTAAAIKAAETYPDKRLIIHYVQPHTPFIGERGREVNQTIGDGFWGGKTFEERKEEKNINEYETIYIRLARGKLDANVEDIKAAYIENLQIALEEVATFVEEVEGRTVVSSDHGECFGEYGIYGHPSGVYIPQLSTVPWLVHDKSRKEIVDGTARVRTDQQNHDEISDRLRALGYVD